MTGKFYHTNEKVLMIMIFAGVAGFSWLSVISGLKELDACTPLIIIFSALLSNISCTYQICGEKLILRNGFIVRKLDISEIRGVNLDMRENGHSRCGGTYFQTVLKIYCCGKEILLHEDLGLIKMEDIMHDPHFIHKKMRSSELNRLSDLISAKIRHNVR